MTRISLAAACIVLLSASAAFADDQNAVQTGAIPLHQIFNVAAYPFGQTIPSSDNTGRFAANGVPEQADRSGKFANNE